MPLFKKKFLNAFYSSPHWGYFHFPSLLCLCNCQKTEKTMKRSFFSFWKLPVGLPSPSPSFVSQKPVRLMRLLNYWSVCFFSCWNQENFDNCVCRLSIKGSSCCCPDPRKPTIFVSIEVLNAQTAHLDSVVANGKPFHQWEGDFFQLYVARHVQLKRVTIFKWVVLFLLIDTKLGTTLIIDRESRDGRIKWWWILNSVITSKSVIHSIVMFWRRKIISYLECHS